MGLVLRVLPLSLALAGCHLLFPLDGFSGAEGGGGAGGGSGPGGGGTASPCEGALICDGFESGIGNWNETIMTNGGAVSADTAQAHRGTHSLHTVADLDGAGTEAYGALRDTPTTIPTLFYARFFAYLPAPAPAGAYAVIAVQENGPANFRGTSLGFQSGQLMVVNWTMPPDTDTVQVANGAFPTNQWVCLEWMLDSTQHQTRVWQNGTEVTELHLTGLVTPLYNWFRFGLDVGGMPDTSYQLWLDDLYVGTSPIGCDR